ncbi:MAG: NAD(P)/FAD-dependent oxidoreductase [Actinomycetes bacterium]
MPPADSRPDSIVIVGAGLAGTYAAAGLRRRGYDGHLALVGAESHRPYDRPPLSKAVLAGADTTRLEDDLGVDLDEVCDEVLLGHRVTRVQPGRLVAGDGWEEPADAVLVATGARPVVPAGWAGVATLRTRDDAQRLRAAMSPATRVAIVGAGWIGSEVAAAAVTAGCDVTLVEALPAPLAREIGTVGNRLRRWHDEAGVRLLTRRRVVAADGDGVTLDGGERVGADLVLAALGVVPDVAWLDGVGEHGVEVGPDLRATDSLGAGVLAAGDCAVRWSPRYQRWIAGGHWEEAMLAGDAAAATLVGEQVSHDPPPYVFSTQYGREVQVVGRPHAGARVVERGDPASSEGWAVGWLLPGDGAERLVAMLAVDRTRDLAQVRRALGTASGESIAVDADVFADAGRGVRESFR